VFAKYLLPAKIAMCSTLDLFRRRPVALLVAGVATLIVVATAFLITAGFIAWLGIYDVAATKKHNEVFAWFLHFTMRNSVKAHASTTPPPRLDDPTLIEQGKRYTELRCAACHGAPGLPADIDAQGMLPPPPKFSDLASEFSPNQLHWIIKHGVKMSAMPPWPTQKRDDEIWGLVAYLKHVNKDPLALPIEPQNDEQGTGIGASVTEKTCFVCHGSDGNGRNGVFPKLAGLSPNYIQKSLVAFKTGERPSGFMQPFAVRLSDGDIGKLADYYGRLDRYSNRAGAAQNEQQIRRGAVIAELGQSTRPSPACQACHVRDDATQTSSVPDLAGQSARYLSTQLKLFRSGIRSGTPDAEIMARVARSLSDADITDVSAYFAALPTRIEDGSRLGPPAHP
jgi:cytochrome c553